MSWNGAPRCGDTPGRQSIRRHARRGFVRTVSAQGFDSPRLHFHFFPGSGCAPFLRLRDHRLPGQNPLPPPRIRGFVVAAVDSAQGAGGPVTGGTGRTPSPGKSESGAEGSRTPVPKQSARSLYARVCGLIVVRAYPRSGALRSKTCIISTRRGMSAHWVQPDV